MHTRQIALPSFDISSPYQIAAKFPTM